MLLLLTPPWRTLRWFLPFGNLPILLMSLFSLPATYANPVATAHVEARLISEVTAIAVQQPFWVALHLKMKPGWHTYWRNPGDSGLATRLIWQLPEGFTASDIHWPYPERIASGPLANYGYHGETALLVQLTPPAQLADNVTLTVVAKWLACEEICIPEQADLTLTLPRISESPPVAAQWQAVFQRARDALPRPAPWPTTFTASDSLQLQIASDDTSSLKAKKLWFFPFDEGVVNHAAPQPLDLHPNGLTLTLTRGDRRAPLTRLTGVLVVHAASPEAAHAYEIVAMPATAPPRVGSAAAIATSPISPTTSASPPPPPSFPAQSSAGVSISLVGALLMALLGGIVLNLMPCVLPVLSMKALSLMQQAHQQPHQVRQQGLLFTAGVLICFTVLAGSLLILRAFGAQIGWGFQLQSPTFTTLISYLLFTLGLSLSGVLTLGNSLMGFGQQWTQRADAWGALATGGLAVIVATPCTAPFMGVALGYALTQPWYNALLIFQTLGVGLALPYLIVSLNPQWLRFLPKPGMWMVRLKELLAFPLYATVIWLIWVLSLQVGPSGVVIALSGMLLIVMAIWLMQQTTDRRWRLVGQLSAVGLLIIALSLPFLSTPDSIATSKTTSDAPITRTGQGPAWEPFSAARLAELQAQNQPIFINFTAAWCITCQVNEQMALRSAKVAAHFAQQGIVYLKADWTNYNPEINSFINQFGRDGVPLYVFYRHPKAEPIILPQILTETLLLETIQARAL